MTDDTIKLIPSLDMPDGSMPLHDLIPILRMVSRLKPKEILEIGTYFGTTTAHLAANAPDAIIHTLDLPPGDGAGSGLEKSDGHLIARREVGKAFSAVPGAKIIQHLCDSATWDYAPVKNVTFCIIDGSHTYEYVRNDTLACLTHCSRPLTLVWHDYDDSHPGVKQFLDEFHPPIMHIPGTNVAFARIP